MDCGASGSSAPCMKDGQCSKKFPKAFQEVTRNEHDGFPLYKRRDNSTCGIEVRKSPISNGWVVPYNPYLLLRYDAHINVEICATIAAVKYLIKYVYKGHDRAVLVIDQSGRNVNPDHGTSTTMIVIIDEIKEFVDTRYISAPEGMWRLNCNRMHNCSHSVLRLAVHLPFEQTVIFRDGEEEKAYKQASETFTTLTAWFEVNKNDSSAHQLRYIDMPQFYTFQKLKGNIRFWQKRKRCGDKVIARMYNVGPSEMERFCLRKLLMHVKGCKKFADIRTHNSVVYPNFKDAAVAWGFLDSDSCWEDTLQAAIGLQMPKQLRQLFAAICVHGNPTHPLQLWTKYKDALCEDMSSEQKEDKALLEIQEHLIAMGKSLEHFGLPTPSAIVDMEEGYCMVEQQELVKEYLPRLNDEQKKACAAILDAVCKGSGMTFPSVLESSLPSTTGKSCNSKLFYVDGPGEKFCLTFAHAIIF